MLTGPPPKFLGTRDILSDISSAYQRLPLAKGVLMASTSGVKQAAIYVPVALVTYVVVLALTIVIGIFQGG